MELEQLTNEPTSEMLPILEVDDFLEKFLKWKNILKRSH